MPAPNPDFVVSDPPPLNSTVFPFAVQEFPALSLRDFAGVVKASTRAPEVAEIPNPHRYED